MDFRPFALISALAAGTAHAEASCAPYCPAPPAGMTAEQAFGSGPVDYGTRTEIYLDNGRVTRITEHLSSDENDETYIYGDTYDELDELEDE